MDEVIFENQRNGQYGIAARRKLSNRRGLPGYRRACIGHTREELLMKDEELQRYGYSASS